jgi:hypothetical protein
LHDRVHRKIQQLVAQVAPSIHIFRSPIFKICRPYLGCIDRGLVPTKPHFLACENPVTK